MITTGIVIVGARTVALYKCYWNTLINQTEPFNHGRT